MLPISILRSLVYARRAYRATGPLRKAYSQYQKFDALYNQLKTKDARSAFSATEASIFPERVAMVYYNALLYSYLYKLELKLPPSSALTKAEFAKGIASTVLPMMKFFGTRGNSLSSYSSVSDTYSSILRATIDGYVQFHAPRFDNILASFTGPSASNPLLHAYIDEFGTLLDGNTLLVDAVSHHMNLDTLEVSAAFATLRAIVLDKEFKTDELEDSKDGKVYFSQYFLTAMYFASRRIAESAFSDVYDTKGSIRQYVPPSAAAAPNTYALARRNPHTPPAFTSLYASRAQVSADLTNRVELEEFLVRMASLGLVSKEAVRARVKTESAEKDAAKT